MHDLILNIRFRTWHFQITESWRPRLFRNQFHQNAGSPVFQVYQFGEHFYG